MDEGGPRVELLRVDPRLLDAVSSLFWAAFPGLRLGQAPVDADGRVPLTVDRPFDQGQAAAWERALDRLLVQDFARAGAAQLREVRDRQGRRLELLLAMEPAAYRGGAWWVGPFADLGDAKAWAAERLSVPWVFDPVRDGERLYLDVFLGDEG